MNDGVERPEIFGHQVADGIDSIEVIFMHAHDLSAAVVEDVSEVGGGQAVIDRHNHRTDLRHGVEGFEVRMGVRRDGRDSISRLDAELARAHLERVDVRRLLKALVQVHESTDAADQTALELDMSSDEKMYVVGIESRIVQVVQNLIGNAFSFTPPGKSVRLAARRDDRMVQITVDDDGPGIPEDNLASVFERFYSERPDSEQFGTHSGLGLSISRQIVEALGGTIKAANRYDSNGAVAGAQFTVRLPAD